MRLLLIALLAAGMCMAFSVQPAYIDVKDTGGQNLPAMNVGISIDCDTKTLTVTATSNKSGEPVAGAKTYLFYTNYAYQAIASGQSGADGVATMAVVGSMNYLTSMFILHVEQQQFKTREIEFTYEKCFQQPPAPHPMPNVTNQTPVNQTINTTNNTQPQNATPPANLTPPGNVTPRPNGTTGPSPNTLPQRPASSIPCLPALLLSALLAMRRWDED
jgi:hypothetical protein